MANKTSFDANCYVCDNYIFKAPITIDLTDRKIKLCSNLCFEKYNIMIEQKKFKCKPAKVEKKEKA